MITIIDYGTGNLRSVTNALDRLGADYRLSSSPAEIASADKVLLPGVGEARTAMDRLREKSLTEVIRSLTCPVLGICLGMQVMCSHSEERDTECLG
ncbi:MAG: imidazole glycerol phosphate synthase subunit HisH, partial [Clostridium sp.]|nr:imidazole glycerol phosphate synthase subunit HisH [Clostridium sp.]